MRLSPLFAVGLAGALLLACPGGIGPKGDTGDQGPVGPQGPPGTPGTTNFSGITGVPPALVLPFPAGASAAIVSSITVTTSSDCGAIAPTPKLQVYVDGQFLAETDVTQSTFADTSPFPINPARYVHEIAVGFPNDSNAGACDHNLHVQQIKLTTAAGQVVIPATDAAHVIYDRGGYFDNVDVLAATPDLGSNGALRFFLSRASPSPGRVSVPIAIGGGLPRVGNFTTAGGTLLVMASAGAYHAAGGTMRVDVAIDGLNRASLFGYTNEISSHKTLSPITFIVSGLGAGPHTMSLGLGLGNVDGNDYSQVTVIELPN